MGTKMNGLTGICDSTTVDIGQGFVNSIMESVPVGYESVLSVSVVAVVGVAILLNCGHHKLKGILGGIAGAGGMPGKSSSASLNPSARFKDIGMEKTDEEECGLLSNRDDEDML